mgnify:CR=1 FL=1
MPFENVMKRATIGATVMISLRAILNDPKRGIRKAVDFFDCFTRGIFDEGLMQRIRREACNPKSSFFKMVTSMAANVDAAVLKTVGTNLCYNRVSLFPAREDRKRKPFPGGARALFGLSLEEAVRYGKKHGVYFYVINGGSSPSGREKVLDVCRQNGDCVFYLCAEGKDVDDRLAGQAALAKNMIFAVNLRPPFLPEESSDGCRAFVTLKRHRCLYGFSVRVDSPAAATGCRGEFVDRMARSGCLFGWYFCGFGKGRKEFLEAVRAVMSSAAGANPPPLLLLDPELDGRMMDRFVTGGRCCLLLGKKKIRAKFFLAGGKQRS